MNLPMRPERLFKWTCPTCAITIRTRLWDMTIGEARLHNWTEHRVSTVPTPVACLWDARINGHRLLCTYDD